MLAFNHMCFLSKPRQCFITNSKVAPASEWHLSICADSDFIQLLCIGYKVGNNQETPRFYFTTLLLYPSVRLCITVCVESRKGVTLCTTAITCLVTHREHDLWCMRYLYVMCVHVSVYEF